MIALPHFTALPPEIELRDAADAANSSGMHLITDGSEVVVSPIVPPGWFRMGVKVKGAA